MQIKDFSFSLSQIFNIKEDYFYNEKIIFTFSYLLFLEIIEHINLKDKEDVVFNFYKDFFKQVKLTDLNELDYLN